MRTSPTLRVARASDDLDALLPFYRDGLGLSVLGRFENHAGFDGVILGLIGAPYHLEFTRARESGARVAPDPDDLLVFYVPDAEKWHAVVSRLRAAGYDPVTSLNPYWDERGLTFEDPDGARVVIQHAAWDA